MIDEDSFISLDTKSFLFWQNSHRKSEKKISKREEEEERRERKIDQFSSSFFHTEK